MTNYKARGTERFCHLSNPISAILPKIPLLRLRGARGVMEIYGNNPLLSPLLLRGRFKESTYFKGAFIGKGQFCI